VVTLLGHLCEITDTAVEKKKNIVKNDSDVSFVSRSNVVWFQMVLGLM